MEYEMETATAKRVYRVHQSGRSDILIAGDSLPDAIERNVNTICRAAQAGNAAGWRLVEVKAEYRAGILGGKGGVELRITHLGLPLAHRAADPTPRQSVLWLHATPDDLPELMKFEIK